MSTFISVKINISHKIYLRDPEQTQLGRKIINFGIRLINELGFESFTFKKLAKHINSTEASLYRYFENKQALLAYITSWYWGWLEYQLHYQTNNIDTNEEKLKIMIRIMTAPPITDSSFSYINEKLLYQVVIHDFFKTLYIKDIEVKYKKGFLRNYHSLCDAVAYLIHQFNPVFSYSQALAQTLLHVANHQVFLGLNIPSTTDVNIEPQNTEQLQEYLWLLLSHTIKK